MVTGKATELPTNNMWFITKSGGAADVFLADFGDVDSWDIGSGFGDWNLKKWKLEIGGWKYLNI